MPDKRMYRELYADLYKHLYNATTQPDQREKELTKFFVYLHRLEYDRKAKLAEMIVPILDYFDADTIMRRLDMEFGAGEFESQNFSSDRCQDDIYKKGSVVLITAVPTKRMERWIRHVRLDSGQPVDWSMYAGRNVIRALGDIKKVEASIDRLWDIL